MNDDGKEKTQSLTFVGGFGIDSRAQSACIAGEEWEGAADYCFSEIQSSLNIEIIVNFRCADLRSLMMTDEIELCGQIVLPIVFLS